MYSLECPGFRKPAPFVAMNRICSAKVLNAVSFRRLVLEREAA
jgi:hypothetical protein